MATCTYISDDETGIPMPADDTLDYLVGTKDVWEPSTELEPNPPDPETDPQWTKANPVDGGWRWYDPVYDEEEQLLGYNVYRMDLVNVPHYRGGQVAQSPIPSDNPPGTVVFFVRTSEAKHAEIHDALVLVDPTFGRYSEVQADE